MDNIWKCECDECGGSDSACNGDCEVGYECVGCWEKNEIIKDFEFDALSAKGMI